MSELEELKSNLASVRFIKREEETGEFHEEILVTTKDQIKKLTGQYLKKGWWQIKPRPDLVCPKCGKSDHIEEWGPYSTKQGLLFLVKCIPCNYPWDEWGFTGYGKSSDKERR